MNKTLLALVNEHRVWKIQDTGEVALSEGSNFIHHITREFESKVNKTRLKTISLYMAEIDKYDVEKLSDNESTFSSVVLIVPGSNSVDSDNSGSIVSLRVYSGKTVFRTDRPVYKYHKSWISNQLTRVLRKKSSQDTYYVIHAVQFR